MLDRTSCGTVEFKKIRESVEKFDSGPVGFLSRRLCSSC